MKARVFAFFWIFALALPGGALGMKAESVAVPIIMYHKVSKDRGQLGELCIAPEEFEADLKFLKDSDFTVVTMAQLVDFVSGEGSLPEKPIVISFDDGYFSDYRYVFPLLLEYDIPIVSSIIGKVTDEYSEEGREDITYPHLLWPQIIEMAESGLVEFQNHGYDLHCFRAGVSGARQRRGENDFDYANRLGEDVTRLQDRIEELLGVRPTTFTYPFGAMSPSSDAVLKELGFFASLASADRKNVLVKGQEDCLFNLGRINRPHGVSLEEIMGR